MGKLYRYRCAECGLGAEVSGGPDAGYNCETDTFYCPTCEWLQDVVTCEYPAETTTTERHPTVSCDRCGNLDLISWQEGCPCPRCKGDMAKEQGYEVLWD